MFTTPCFIRKSTPELIQKLWKLGYHLCPTCMGLDIINPYIFVYRGYYAQSPIGCQEEEIKCMIDCGENEDLLLAIAALRDDSDEYQWFVYNNTWFKCDFESIEDKRIEARNNNYFGASIYNCHKATVEELIEHFKNKHHGR